MKKIIRVCAIICILFGYTSPIKAQESFDIVSEYAILINLDDDQVIYEKNSDEKMYPASMTKVMTVLTALEHIDNLDEVITIDSFMLEGLQEANASVAGFSVNEQVTLRDLIYGALLPSGADACRALAFYIAGSEEAFVALMNQKAEALNLKATHLMNVTGLHEDEHYTTTREMAVIVEHALDNETFKEAFITNEYTTTKTIQHPDGLIMDSSLRKSEKQFGFTPDVVTGAKTGFTLEGGLCLASIGYRDNAHYLLVTGNAGNDSSYPQHIADAHTIYDDMYSTYDYSPVWQTDTIVSTIKVKYNFFHRSIDVKFDETISALLPRDADLQQLEVTFNGSQEMEAPIEEKQLLGNVIFSYEGEVLKEVPFYAPEAIGKNWLLFGLAKLIEFIVAIRYLLLALVIAIVAWVWYRRYLVLQRKKKRQQRRKRK